jgi:hypothetical protein
VAAPVLFLPAGFFALDSQILRSSAPVMSVSPSRALSGEIRLKVVLLGETSAGKTSLFRRLKGDSFDWGEPATIRTDCCNCSLEIAGSHVAIVTAYLRGPNGVFLLFFIASSESFDALDDFSAMLTERAPEFFVLLEALYRRHEYTLAGADQVAVLEYEAKVYPRFDLPMRPA